MFSPATVRVSYTPWHSILDRNAVELHTENSNISWFVCTIYNDIVLSTFLLSNALVLHINSKTLVLLGNNKIGRRSHYNKIGRRSRDEPGCRTLAWGSPLLEKLALSDQLQECGARQKELQGISQDCRSPS